MSKIVRAIEGKPLLLPDSLLCVEDGQVFDMASADICGSKFVVYIDSTECSECQVSRFVRYIDLFRLSDKMPLFHVLLIVSHHEKELEEFQNRLVIKDMPFPIYIDKELVFFRNNPNIPPQ